MYGALKQVINFLEETRQKYNIPKEKLEKNGQIIYANGNDGTDFDWEVNGKLCEFGYGTADGAAWAFKLLLDKSGEATIYCYPNGEDQPVERITRKLLTKNKTLKLKEYMYNIADAKMRWDLTLEELGEEGIYDDAKREN